MPLGDVGLMPLGDAIITVADGHAPERRRTPVMPQRGITCTDGIALMKLGVPDLGRRSTDPGAGRRIAAPSAEHAKHQQRHQQDDDEHDGEDPPEADGTLDDRWSDDGDGDGVEGITRPAFGIGRGGGEHVGAGWKALLERGVRGVEHEGEPTAGAHRLLDEQTVVEQVIDLGERRRAVRHLDAEAHLPPQHLRVAGHPEAWRDRAELNLDGIAGVAGDDSEHTAADRPSAEVDGDLVEAAPAEDAGKLVAHRPALRLVERPVADGDQAGAERLCQAGQRGGCRRQLAEACGIVAAEADDDELHRMLARIRFGQTCLDRRDVDGRAGVAGCEHHQRALGIVGRLPELVETGHDGVAERIRGAHGAVERFGHERQRRICLVDHVADQPQIMAQRHRPRHLDLIGECDERRKLVGFTLQRADQLAGERAGVLETADGGCGAGVAHARTAIEDQRDGDRHAQPGCDGIDRRIVEQHLVGRRGGDGPPERIAGEHAYGDLGIITLVDCQNAELHRRRVLCVQQHGSKCRDAQCHGDEQTNHRTLPGLPYGSALRQLYHHHRQPVLEQ